ncbi:mucin-22-like isoform X1 [Haliotis asinina]|uniref:mucin-22-like isoform X1 n=1 Tax=Haliotis asinina TaxID=109174 RepID=UPI0035327474
MASRIVLVCLFNLSFTKDGIACGGNSALKVVEMCKGGSATDDHFYLHGSPAGGVQRCVCYLTITGAATSVNFTPLSVTNTAAACGGTLTLVDGSMRDCGWLSGADIFSFSGTSAVTFAYNSPDVRFCVEVEKHTEEANIYIECPLSTTTTATLSSRLATMTPQTTTAFVIPSSTSTTTLLPLNFFTSSYTSTPSSTRHLATSTLTSELAKSTTVSSSENQPTPSPVTNIQSSTENDKPEGTTVEHKSLSGLLIAGWVIAAILVAVIVVIVVLLMRKSRQSNYESREPCRQSVSTQTDGGSIYEELYQGNMTKPDTLYERIETQSAGLGMKDYYNFEMGDYCNP